MKAEEVQTQAADIWQDPYFINVEFGAMCVFNNKYYNFLMGKYCRLQYDDI
jgi:hypothetical protein